MYLCMVLYIKLLCVISRQLAQAYVVATTSAVAVAVGLNSLVKVCSVIS